MRPGLAWLLSMGLRFRLLWKGCWVLPGEILGTKPWLRDLWACRQQLQGKPALIVWGMKDIAFREKELNTWVGALPGAQVVRQDDVKDLENRED